MDYSNFYYSNFCKYLWKYEKEIFEPKDEIFRNFKNWAIFLIKVKINLIYRERLYTEKSFLNSSGSSLSCQNYFKAVKMKSCLSPKELYNVNFNKF